jgi:site-specific DNA-cytosine methylase
MFVCSRSHTDQTALPAQTIPMHRADTSSASADSDSPEKPKTIPSKTVTDLESPRGSRINTSSESASSDERPQGPGNRGRGSRRGGRGKRGGHDRGRGSNAAGSAEGHISLPQSRKPTKSARRGSNAAGSVGDRIMTSESASDDEPSASTDSPESARIREAARIVAARNIRLARSCKTDAEIKAMWDSGQTARELANYDRIIGRGKQPPHTGRPNSSSESETHENYREGKQVPFSSGVFDYMEWVVNNILTDAEKDIVCAKAPLSIGSMCSGMGTEDLACRAIGNAMLRAGRESFKAHSAYKAESDVHKIEFLKRHTTSSTQIFASNSALAQAEAQNVNNEIVARPTSKVLTAGIVCIDISSMSSTPQAVSGVGKSGDSLRGLLDSLDSMPLGERPILIILECVPRLAHHRKVDPDHRSGAQYILDELSKFGYVGEWHTVRPRDFYLPQSRNRVYAVNLLRNDFTEASAQIRRADLERAKNLLARMVLSKPEPLATLLQNCSKYSKPIKHPRKPQGQTMEAARKSKRKWPEEHDMYAKALGLPVDAYTPPSDFVQVVSPLIPVRAMNAMWLKLEHMRLQSKKGEVDFDWKKMLLIAPTTFSIGWGQIRKSMFPCATPGMSYVIVENGQAQLATGLTMMAVQGIQGKEVESFRLDLENDKLLRDLAGNAFTANIIAAYLLAGALVM